MVASARPVFFVFVLLTGISYVFAVALCQLLKDTDAGDAYFPTVHKAMDSLSGNIILTDEDAFLKVVGRDGWVYQVVIMVYILLASLTVMNLLVGVLCEVVGVVSSVEREAMIE